MALNYKEVDGAEPPSESVKPSFDRVKKQFLVVVIGNILAFSQGSNVAWFSPALPLLMHDQSPLVDGPISRETAGWIGSVLAVGGIIGSLGFGLMANWFGYKRAMQFAAFPMALSWIFIIFGNYSWQIGLSRFFSGIAGGAAFTCFPQFVAEIASDHVRGQLSSYTQIAGYSGILVGFIGGSYLPYVVNPIVMLLFPVSFFIGFFSMPESPQFLLRKNRIEEAEKSLRYYRNVKPTDEALNNQLIYVEFEKFRAIAKQNEQQPSLKVSDFVNPIALRAMIISPFLISVNQFSGGFAISNYAVTIFKSTGSTIDPQMSSIVMAIVQVIGMYTSSQLMDKVGRKILLLVSLSGSIVTHGITGVFSYLAKNEYDMEAFNWVPIVSISSYIFFCSIGIVPVPYVMLAEVIPQRIRRIAAAICSSITYVGQMIVLSLIPVLLNEFDLFGCMLMFTSVLVIGLLFTILVVRETKGKNLDVLEENTSSL